MAVRQGTRVQDHRCRTSARSSRTRSRILATAVAAAALGAAACSGDPSPGPSGAETPTILATTSIWADVVANVACDGLAEVEAIIPVGGDPHGYEPSLQDAERMTSASLVVANGLTLEGRLEDTLATVADSGTPVLMFAEHMDPIPFQGHHDDHDEEGHDEHEGHDHGTEDPHVWLDPHRVAEALPVLAQALTADAGLDAAAVEACLTSYRAELEAVDAEIAAKVEQLPAESRKLVTNHDAFEYYATRYGFEVIGTVIPSSSSLAEANPAGLEELAEVIEHEGIKAIFAELQHSGEEIEALAARIGGVEVVTLYTGSLGPPGSGAETYTGYLRTNTDLIVDSLN
ncbi:MAG: zinc ABC transporter substrate-binding protein [Acidimicrobiaceae bacterium]|nr:zinc ABC transporter substrate-binding protein [Acidimicrobiaceae bacterium]